MGVILGTLPLYMHIVLHLLYCTWYCCHWSVWLYKNVSCNGK